MFTIILIILIIFSLVGPILRSIFGINLGNSYERKHRHFDPQEAFQYYQQRSSQNDFGTMLMALTAAVMKADGKILKAELDYVKTYLRSQFSEAHANQLLRSLKQFIDSEQIPLNRICTDIKMRMVPEARLQLVHFLLGIAKSDNTVSTSEMKVIADIATLLGVPLREYESVRNMYYRDVNSDYVILGVTAQASDEEIKKAYRQMAIKFHPDKVASMGEEYQKGAKEKFQKIQEAYDNIKKDRGFK